MLVHRPTGEAYGPADIIRAYSRRIRGAYPSFGLMPAVDAVRRLAKTARLDKKGKALVARFIGLAPVASEAGAPLPEKAGQPSSTPGGAVRVTAPKR
ncbi:MAG: hypothetical protein ABSD47_02230 [Candidatus Methylomirabilota bacterium]